MKRGELSMEVIIIAAIALLILVILTVLLVRKGGDLNEGTSCTAPSIGGTCVESVSDCEGGYPSKNSCPNRGEICCVPLGGEE